MITSITTPGGSAAGLGSPVSSSRLKQASTQSPTKNTTVDSVHSDSESREATPELPISDKSDSSGNSENDTQNAISTPNYDAETQDTAIVPDSAQASPTPSLPPLSSSAVQKMLFSASGEGQHLPLTPSKLSQAHLAQLQDDILAENDETLAELTTPMEDDSISLQSDLKIADLDPDNWKQLVISYGAEPRSDDEEIFDSLEPGKLQSSAARKRNRTKHTSAAGRKGSRASTRHVERDNKVLTPSKGASTSYTNGSSIATPARSSTRTIRTYGKRGHRATTSTSSEADTRKSARTSMTGTTSGESDCVEVTTERKAGVLRHVTPDGTIIPNTETYTPSRRVMSSKKGKERAVEPPATTEEEEEDDDDEMDLDLPDLVPGKKDKGKSPEKASNRDQSRSTRQLHRDRALLERPRIRTPSLSPPPSEPAPFVPLTTATEGKALSAMEIIAQMRARNKPIEEPAKEEEEAKETKADQDEEDPDLQLRGDIDLRKRAAAIQDDDSDEDDLVDTKTLLERAKNAPRKAEQEPEQPVASTSTTLPDKPKSNFRLPMDKASQSLNKLFKSRQAEEARGWYGIDEASREEAGYKRQSSSTSPGPDDEGNNSPSADTGYNSDSSASSSLPDAPSTNNKKATDSKGKMKRPRRHSNGQLTRVVSHLTKSKEDEGVVEAIKLAQDELEEARARARRRKEQEERLFWKQLGTDEDMEIEPCKPYETAGTKGFDYALRQGILDGLANPASFPVELISPYITSTSALLSSVSASYSLYHLIAHPCTNPILANRVLPFLSTLLRKLPSGGALDTDIDLSSIVDSLAAMGAKKDQFTEEMRSSAAMEDTPEAMAADKSKKVTFTTDQRQAATLRIMHLLRVLIETKRIEMVTFPSLMILLLRMALDTSDHSMRNAAVQSLHLLLEQDLNIESLMSITRTVSDFIEPLSSRDRYVVMSFLPLNSESQRDIVRGLCYSLLFPREDKSAEPMGGRKNLSLLSSTLSDRETSSTFFISEDTDNASLYYAVLLLQYLLTDLSKYYVEDVYSEDPEVIRRATQARADALGIINGMTDIDSKLRTDVRGGNPMRNKAKNALIRALHSMEYHLRAAQDRVEKVNMKRRLGGRTLAQPVDGQVGQGQISINSYFTKASTSAGNGT